MAVNYTLADIKKSQMLALISALALFGGCCTSIETLEPVHKYTAENQRNLASNIEILLGSYVNAVESHQDYEASDAVILEAQVATIREQIAIATAYVVLIDVLLAGHEVTAESFEKLIDNLPIYTTEGIKLWDALHDALKKEDK